MKILLANAPWYYFDKDKNEMRYGIRAGSRWPFTINYYGGYKPFPFFLAYAHSYIKQHGVESYFLDSVTARQTYIQFYNEINRIDPEFALLEISTPSIENDFKIIDELSKNRKIIVSGTHATVFANELIKNKNIYAVLKGTYEGNLLEFVLKPENKIYENVVIKLNDLPFPERDDRIIWLYKERTHENMHRQISLLSSRGCPFGCIFCQWPSIMFNNKMDFRSLDSIDKEIYYLIQKYGNKIFLYFDDDTFNLIEDRTINIGNIVAKYNLKWSAMCRVDTLSKKAWKELYKQGLTHVNIGIESASKNVLDKINKKLNIEVAEDMIKYLNELGMYVHATFTFGTPSETKEDIKITKEFYKRINVASKQQSHCIPLPGTIWWNNLSEKERKIDYDGYKKLSKIL